MNVQDRGMEKALLRAQANADYFGVSFVVFVDSTGVIRVERHDSAVDCHNDAGSMLLKPATSK